MPEKKKHAGGRPRIEIPLDELVRYCERQCSDDELAAIFGCTTRTIEMRKRDPEFKAAMLKGKARGKILLRSKLFEKALGDEKKKIPSDTTALIFACKSILGLSDRVEVAHTGKDGKPIEVKHTGKREETDLLDKFLTQITATKIDGSQGAQESSREPISA